MSATRTNDNSTGGSSTALAERTEGQLTRGAPAGYRAGRLDIDHIDMDAAKKFPLVLNEFYKSIMQQGTDYGTIPGTPKPSLWKNGGELLCKAFRMVEDTQTITAVENFDPNDPFFSYVIKCRLWGEDGGFLGAGDGASNSREPQYAFRWFFEDQLPSGTNKDGLKTRQVGKGERKYTQYNAPIPKEEVFGLQNVVLKKAKKRAFIDAVLSATGASRIFTQDMADEDAPVPVKDEPAGPAGGPVPPAEPTASKAPAVEKPGVPAGKATLASFDQVWMGFEQERDDGLVTVEPLPDGTIVIRKKSVATGDVLDALRTKIKGYGGKMVVDGEKGTYWTIPTPA